MTRPLVEYVTPWLVDNPDEVRVEEVSDDRGGLVIELTVDAEDIGKVIGKRGRIIRALRILSKAAGQREGTTVTVEVMD
jgi:predicted RNA-binding protein YlqC (UPF0109 family)